MDRDPLSPARGIILGFALGAISWAGIVAAFVVVIRHG